ncbi:hypothetical protein [Hyphococcus sp. DH-69]|uniref:hypothetical protein n=1 Tax=Hyphococcus formosus TaxID=3143534 RepID=UPI00398AB769
MSGAPSGFFGKLSAERPILLGGVVGLGLVVLAVMGMRHQGDAAGVDLLLLRNAMSALIAIFVPLALAALTPRKPILQGTYVAVVVIAGGLLSAYAMGAFGAPIEFLQPLIFAAGLGLFVFLSALMPILRNLLRLGFVGPLASIVGIIGAIGFLALVDLLQVSFAAPLLTLYLVGGLCVGMSVAAEFAQLFAKGYSARGAAGAAGHAALAPGSFCILSTLAYGIVMSLELNLGELDLQTIAFISIATVLVAAMSLICSTGALALLRHTEQVAVDENYRRQRFAESWRPMRRLLPGSTAIAGSAIIGVLVVVSGFETGIADPLSFFLFIGLIMIASGAAFVSVRTSSLIAIMLFVSAIFAALAYQAIGIELPTLQDRLLAQTLAGMSFAQITVSWRNAGDIWRNARDITQNAMSDGLRRFVFLASVSVSALIVSSIAMSWPNGLALVSYFAVIVAIGLIISPILMVALSAQAQRL